MDVEKKRKKYLLLRDAQSFRGIPNVNRLDGVDSLLTTGPKNGAAIVEVC
jgi:hypothetical protein